MTQVSLSLSEFVEASEEVVVRSHTTKEIELREILLKEHLVELAIASYSSQKNHKERRDLKHFSSKTRS